MCRVADIHLSHDAFVPLELIDWLCSGCDAWHKLSVIDCPSVTAEVMLRLMQPGRVLQFQALSVVNLKGSGGNQLSSSCTPSPVVAIKVLRDALPVSRAGAASDCGVASLLGGCHLHTLLLKGCSRLTGDGWVGCSASFKSVSRSRSCLRCGF